ncbi:MAG TPA: hypothetical protein V6D29_10120 [Leptolyngbyaceae cyanobacterium]
MLRQPTPSAYVNRGGQDWKRAIASLHSGFGLQAGFAIALNTA